MDIRKRVKEISSRQNIEPGTSWWKQRNSAVLFLSLAAVGLLLVLTVTGSHFLSMEAKNGVDFNVRSIHPLTSRVDEGDKMALGFNIRTRVPGIYRLKIFSPTGLELASEMKLVRGENPGVWNITSEFENDGFGRYEIELSGLLNKHENQYYRTYFWVEDAAETEAYGLDKISRESSGDSQSYPSATTQYTESSGERPHSEYADNNVEFTGDAEDQEPSSDSEPSADPESSEAPVSGNTFSEEPASSQEPETSSNSGVEESGDQVNESSDGSGGEETADDNPEITDEGTGYGLHMDSNPRGSRVYIDGSLKGSTPLNVTDLPEGTYELELELEGYESETLKVRIKASESIDVYRQLNREFGWLAVNSTPGNASVYVDGYSKGRTPLELELASGEHQLKLVTEGYEDRVESVSVVGKETVSLEWELEEKSEPAYETGTLYISSIPTGSTIYLNGHKMGTTPGTLTDLPAGTYRLRLALYGYESFETKIKVVPGETTPIYQPLVEIEKEESDEGLMITALHIKAFIIFMIAGFIVYVVIYKLLKEM